MGDDLIKWAAGLMVMAYVAITGHTHVRINRVEDRREKDKVEQTERRADLYAKMEKHQTELVAFRETVFKEYPTKKDIGKMEQRIIAAMPKGDRNG